MPKYKVTDSIGVAYVRDIHPQPIWNNEVCTIYTKSSCLSPAQVSNSLNMAHELSQLPAKATKAQMQAIINKYKI